MTAATPSPRRGVNAAMTRPMPASTSANRTAPASADQARRGCCRQNGSLASSAPTYSTISGSASSTNSAAVIAGELGLHVVAAASAVARSTAAIDPEPQVARDHLRGLRARRRPTTTICRLTRVRACSRAAARRRRVTTTIAAMISAGSDHHGEQQQRHHLRLRRPAESVGARAGCRTNSARAM